MINGVNSNQVVAQKYEASKKQENAKATDSNGTKAQEAAAVLELGKTKENATVTYTKPASNAALVATLPAEATTETAENNKTNKTKTTTTSAQEINELWAQANRATQNLRDMVEALLKSQGKSLKDALKGKEELIVDEKTRVAAEQSISEDGENGVQAVSDRIVAFAKAVSNDNPEMYDKLMSAIDEGFAQAEKAFGGELPEISKKTREEINRKMEEWKSGKAENHS